MLRVLRVRAWVSCRACRNRPRRGSDLTDSEILAGLLVVAGRTERAHESITLDGKFTAVSDRHRRFAFQVPYYPPSCMVTLKTDGDERTAAVAVCGR